MVMIRYHLAREKGWKGEEIIVLERDKITSGVRDYSTIEFHSDFSKRLF
jgi:hypothetical protein